MTNPIQQLVDAARELVILGGDHSSPCVIEYDEGPCATHLETYKKREDLLLAAILAVESAEVETRWEVEVLGRLPVYGWQQVFGSGFANYGGAVARRAQIRGAEMRIVRIDTYRTVEKEQLLTPPAGEKGE